MFRPPDPSHSAPPYLLVMCGPELTKPGIPAVYHRAVLNTSFQLQATRSFCIARYHVVYCKVPNSCLLQDTTLLCIARYQVVVYCNIPQCCILQGTPLLCTASCCCVLKDKTLHLPQGRNSKLAITKVSKFSRFISTL